MIWGSSGSLTTRRPPLRNPLRTMRHRTEVSVWKESHHQHQIQPQPYRKRDTQSRDPLVRHQHIKRPSEKAHETGSRTFVQASSENHKLPPIMNKGDGIDSNGGLRSTNGSVRSNEKSNDKKKSINDDNWRRLRSGLGKIVGNRLVRNPWEANSCHKLNWGKQSGPGKPWPKKNGHMKNATKRSIGIPRATYQYQRNSILQLQGGMGWYCQGWIPKKNLHTGKRYNPANAQVWDKPVLRQMDSRWTKAKSKRPGQTFARWSKGPMPPRHQGHRVP